MLYLFEMGKAALPGMASWDVSNHGGWTPSSELKEVWAPLVQLKQPLWSEGWCPLWCSAPCFTLRLDVCQGFGPHICGRQVVGEQLFGTSLPFPVQSLQSGTKKQGDGHLLNQNSLKQLLAGHFYTLNMGPTGARH